MDSSGKALEGGCTCGKVRYRLKAAPMIVHACHCADCRRLTGSAFGVNAWIEASAVELVSGDLSSFETEGGGGKPHEVFSCDSCQGALWSKYHAAGDCLFVRAGTLDEPDALTPDVHIFTRSKAPWVEPPEGIPAFEAFYDLKAVWPAESLSRLKANR